MHVEKIHNMQVPLFMLQHMLHFFIFKALNMSE